MTGGSMTLDDVSVTATAPQPAIGPGAIAKASPSPVAGGDQVTIKVGGMTLGGWTEATVTRGVLQLPSAVEITATERNPFSGTGLDPEPGLACEVRFGGDLVLTGYIDRYAAAYGPSTHSVKIIARSKTADLVDCSIDVRKVGWVFLAQTIGRAAATLADPYGIKVRLPDGDADLPIKYFPVAAGETAYALLEEMARSVGMLLWDNPSGDLVISKGGTGGRATDAIVEGQNVESVTAIRTMDQRFSDYLVLSQAANEIAAHTNGRGEAQDKKVPRNRLKIIPQEVPGPGVPASQQRANWEAAHRYGQSQQTRVTVTGWRQSNEQLWTPNTVASARLPTGHVSADLVIADVTWTQGENGTRAVMTLMPASGLLPEPLVFLPQIPGVGLPAPH